MRIVVLICMLLLGVSCSFSQTQESKLKELGFENIKVLSINDTMYVSVEDPVYRGTFRGAGVAIKNLSLMNPSINFYRLVVKEDNVDKYAIVASKSEERWVVNVDYESKDVQRILESEEARSVMPKDYNSSVGKVNVTFYPVLSFSNNSTSKLFSHGVMLAPAIETSLWKGNKLVFQPIIPLFNNYDEFDKNPTLSHFQLGSVSIRQDFATNAKWWGKLYAGFFHYNYVGVDLDLGLHLNKYLDVGLIASATRWQDMNEGSVNITDDNLYSALFTLSYYEPVSSLEVKMTVGRFMYGDYGGRLDGICHFGEYSVGVYGIYTGGEYNGGFHFSIPFAGKSQKRMGMISLRIPDFFDWEYSMVSNYDWAYKNCGKCPEPLPARNRSGNYWQARYIQTYLQKYLDGEVE